MTHLYRIEVFSRGQMISEHTVEAADALSAINLVETEYGEPPQVGYKTIYHEDGTKEHILDVTDWHGYSFVARSVELLSH